MKNTANATDQRTGGIPEDLLIFRGRMSDNGISVRLPTAGPDYALPEPIQVDGEPLSETVKRLRAGGA
jgi:hypothetical protein